jgi:muconolactone delta-isomerase
MSNRKITAVLFVLLTAVALAAPTAARAELYLVRGTFIDPGILSPPQTAIPAFENVVFPSIAMLDQWVKDGKASGGVIAGDRAGILLIDAPSSDAVDTMLQSLPFWGLLKWEVTPLVSYGDRLIREKAMMAKMKGMMKPDMTKGK